jgi:hypothetical protein
MGVAAPAPPGGAVPLPAGWALLVCGEREPVPLQLPVAVPIPERGPRGDEQALAWAAREAEGAELEEVVRAG